MRDDRAEDRQRRWSYGKRDGFAGGVDSGAVRAAGGGNGGCDGRWGVAENGDAKAKVVRGAVCGAGGESEKAGKYEGAGGRGGGGAQQEVDAGLVNAGVGGRGLGEDHVGVAGSIDVGESAEVELVTADVDGGLANGLADDRGDGYLLRAEGDRNADLPAMADSGAGSGGLRKHSTGGDGGGVKAVFDVEVNAGIEGGGAGFADGHAGEVGDRDLVAVEGDAQGDGRRKEHDGEHGESGERDAEVTLHRAEVRIRERVVGGVL